MLSQPLMEKLVAMRWQGVVEGLKTQEQDRAIHELSFHVRKLPTRAWYACMTLVLAAAASLDSQVTSKHKATKIASAQKQVSASQASTGATGNGSPEDEQVLAAAIPKSFNSAPIADLFTGSMGLSVPIYVSPGRKGVQPKIQLEYHSDRGNGWLGMGWDLNVGAIERDTLFGLDYDADAYDLVLNGRKQKLVRSADGYYHTKVEDNHLRIDEKQDTHRDWWQVDDGLGMHYFFGEEASSRQDDGSNKRIFKWCLDKVEDSNGNFILFLYDKQIDLGEIYLKQIEYTASRFGLTANQSVRFLLEDRPDVADMYSTAFRVRAAHRLKSIEMISNGELMRAYDLARRFRSPLERTSFAI
jgi:hypothetical protein